MASVRRIRLGDNNVYLFEAGGERAAIDAGPDFAAAPAALAAALGATPPALVFATHGHLDHAGLGHWWQARGVPVALARADLHLARGPALLDPGEFAVLRAFVEASGAPTAEQAEAIGTLEARREHALLALRQGRHPGTADRRWPGGLRYLPFTPAVMLEGEVPLVAGELVALPAPGHTPGNMVAIAPREGWLFSGDQLLPELTPTPAIQGRGVDGGRFRSLPAFVAALRNLEAMNFSRCYPGHGEPFDNVAEVIRENLAQAKMRAERAWTELRASGPSTLYALAERLYPRALRRRFWQIAPTVQGILDLLEEGGRVETEAGLFAAR